MRLFVLGELLGVVLKNRGGCRAQPNPAGESQPNKAPLPDSTSLIVLESGGGGQEHSLTRRGRV